MKLKNEFASDYSRNWRKKLKNKRERSILKIHLKNYSI